MAPSEPAGYRRWRSRAAALLERQRIHRVYLLAGEFGEF
jgi:hypothetical protein